MIVGCPSLRVHQKNGLSLFLLTLHFPESRCDASRDNAHAPAQALNFKCSVCDECFLSSKALECHKRIRHKSRAPQRFYAPASGVCPVCQNVYNSRLRLLAHLCDRRRDRCWKTITVCPSNYTALSPTPVDELDVSDRCARREACKAGHSHSLAVGTARTAAGKSIGHVKR